MQLRKAALTDIPAIMQLVAEVVPAMQAAGNYQWNADYPNAVVFESDIELGQLWVAVVGKEIAGVAALSTAPEPDYAQAGVDINTLAVVTHRLAVSDKYRGQGIAAALLKQAEVVAHEKGITAVRVDTNVENQATNKLFSKMGYKLLGEIGLSHKPGLRFYCYEKVL